MAYSREIEKLKARWNENPHGTTFAPYAEALRKTGELELAQEVLRQGLANHPDHIPGNIVLGRCSLDLQDYGAAESSFTHVLELDPENVIALKALADITERHGRLAEASQWLQQLTAVDPSNEEAREQMARVEAARDEAARALFPAAPSAEPGEAVQPPAAPPLAAEASDWAAALAEEDTLVVEAMASQPVISTEPPQPAPAPADQESLPIPSGYGPTAFGGLEITPAVAEPEPMMPSLEPEPIGMGEVVTQPMMGLESHDLDLTSAGAGLETQKLDDIVLEQEDLLAPDPRAFVGELQPKGVEEGAFEIGVEQAEDIVLQASDAGSEFQTPSDSEALLGLSPAASEFQSPNASEELIAGRASAEFSGSAAEADLPPQPASGLPLIFPQDVEEESARASGGRRGDSEAPEPSVGEPDLVVTETMAELYERQGHPGDALKVYRELSGRNPDDPRLRDKVAQLERDQERPRNLVPGGRPAYAASVSGGQSVEAFFHSLLSQRLPQPAGTESARSSPAAASGEGDILPDTGPGAPTRPAKDSLSLSAIFGEEASPVPPVAPAADSAPPAGASQAGAFSFDQFFGGKSDQKPASRTSGPGARSSRPSGLEEDLDQFQNWLKSLKR